MVAYLFIQFGGKAGTELLLRQQALLLPHADESLCQESYVPQGTALSPLALGNLTGNPQATTDRLIVAARHAEVSFGIFHIARASLHMLPISVQCPCFWYQRMAILWGYLVNYIGQVQNDAIRWLDEWFLNIGCHDWMKVTHSLSWWLDVHISQHIKSVPYSRFYANFTPF